MVERDPDFNAYYDSGIGLKDFVRIHLILSDSYYGLHYGRPMK